MISVTAPLLQTGPLIVELPCLSVAEVLTPAAQRQYWNCSVAMGLSGEHVSSREAMFVIGARAFVEDGILRVQVPQVRP
jgi:hypothetical protein